MSITASEMLWRYPQERSDAASNGGRMTSTEIVHAIKNNIWPDIPQSERTAGSTKYRKAFIHIANDDDITLVRPRVFVETYTPGDDYVTIFQGTAVDTQTDIVGNENQYGAGKLNADVLAAVTTITVLTELDTLDIFRDGELIRISNKANVDDDTGTEEYILISGVPTYVGHVATIELAQALVYPYNALDTKVASVIEPADIEAGYHSFVDTTVGTGVYDDVTHPILLDSIGSIEQNWTISYNADDTFDITGDTVGFIGTGNTSGVASPDNADFSKPYFTLSHLGFSGVWADGDTITFTTTAAAPSIWYKRTIPAGANSLTGDKVIVAIDGESA